MVGSYIIQNTKFLPGSNYAALQTFFLHWQSESNTLLMKKSLYVASPLGFSEAGNYFMLNQLFPLLHKLGYGIIDPWKLTEQAKIEKILAMEYGREKKEAWARLNPEIGKNNQAGIEKSDGLLAILDGVDVDSGTASEIGYAAALKKPVLGYRGDFRLAADNDGSIVNLQVEFFVRLHGGTIVTSLAEMERCLPEIFPL